jgi:hypothetical protein
MHSIKHFLYYLTENGICAPHVAPFVVLNSFGLNKDSFEFDILKNAI